MKKHQVLVSLVMLVLLFSLFAPAVQAEEEALQTTWDMTPADMYALEGVLEADGEYEIGEGLVQYAFQRLTDTYVYAAIYIFAGEQLIMYGDYTDTSIQYQDVAYDEVFQEWTDALAETHGEPTLADTQPAVELANMAVKDGWLTEEAIAGFAGWMPEEGLLLYCIYFTNEDEDVIFAVNINAALFFAQ